MEFHVGQKVVCVDADSGEHEWRPEDRIFIGSVYTILRCFTDAYGGPAVHLWEVKRTGPRVKEHGADKIGYGAFRFRPIVEKKTDISIFHEILRKVSRKDRVRA